MDTVSEFHAEAPQATVSTYVMARLVQCGDMLM